MFVKNVGAKRKCFVRGQRRAFDVHIVTGRLLPPTRHRFNLIELFMKYELRVVTIETPGKLKLYHM